MPWSYLYFHHTHRRSKFRRPREIAKTASFSATLILLVTILAVKGFARDYVLMVGTYPTAPRPSFISPPVDKIHFTHYNLTLLETDLCQMIDDHRTEFL